jgi:CrcB protein
LARRVFVFVGVLGGFTTFSSLMLDMLTLTQGGERALAVSNLALQTLAGLAAVWWGYSLGLGD